MNLKSSFKLSFVLLIVGLTMQGVSAKVALPAIFSDHMVMQQNADVKLWGWGKPFETVSIMPSWSKDTLQTVVNHNGNWSVMLHTTHGHTIHSLRIQGYNTLEVNDILMGEIWLCSGQSNMEWSASHGYIGSDDVTRNGTHEEIRLFHVNWRSSPYKTLDVVGHWVKCTPETVYEFSAIAYLFGQELQDKLKMPVGLISSNWGGTPIECWIPEHEILANSYLCDAAGKIPYFPWAPNKPGYVYNAMIAPIMPFPIAGVLWYQGEANVDNAYAYSDMLTLLVSNWRKDFQTDFSFVYAQIAPYRDYLNDDGVKVRDAQRRALSSIPHSVMVVLGDIGDTTDIHPRNKIDAGKRLAHVALNQTYGFKTYPLSGPLFKNFIINGDKVEVEFDYAEGLYCSEKELEMFELAGQDLKWYKAKAQLKNDKVMLTSNLVKRPLYVRFEWRNAVMPTLFNQSNLPASSFTTLEWRKAKHSL